MDGHGEHAREEIRPGRGGVLVKGNLLVMLIMKELMNMPMKEQQARFIPGFGIFNGLTIHKRPKTKMEALNDRSDKGMVRVIKQEGFENIDIYRSNDLEKVRTEVQCGIDNGVVQNGGVHNGSHCSLPGNDPVSCCFDSLCRSDGSVGELDWPEFPGVLLIDSKCVLATENMVEVHKLSMENITPFRIGELRHSDRIKEV